MKILITGDRGFVGEETRKVLEKAGNIVIRYDLMDTHDILDADEFELVVRTTKPNRILHLAAVARFSDADANPRLAFETNVDGTVNVATVAHKYHIPLVYASTGSVYMPIKEKPPITESFAVSGNSVYGCTKLLGELYVKDITNPWIILRYAHLYGKEKRGHGLIGGFVERIERGLAPTLYGGRQSNDFTYIRDIARANALALESSWDRWNQIYNIGTGEEITAEEAGKVICEATGYQGKIQVKEARTVDPERFVFDVSKAERMLGFKAEFNFKDGLADMFKKAG